MHSLFFYSPVGSAGHVAKHFVLPGLKSTVQMQDIIIIKYIVYIVWVFL